MRKTLSYLFVLVLALSLGAVARAPAAVQGSGFEYATTISVPGDHPTIQAAINATGAGDAMIVVQAGEYEAFVVLEKEDLLIRGIGEVTVTSAASVPIDRGEIGEAWVMAAVKDSQNIRIEGISFDGVGVTGEEVVIGIAYANSTGEIADLTVEGMSGSILGAGVLIGAGTVDISGTRITGNMVGLFFCDSPVVEAHYNSIEGNTEFGALNQELTPVHALYNWWGSALGPFHTTNLTGTGNPVSDNVDFRPWASGPIAVFRFEGAGEENLDAKAEADTTVRVVVQDQASGLVQATNDNGESIVTEVRVAKLTGPEPEPSPPGDLWFPLNMYIQVGVESTGPVSEVEIRLFYKSDLAREVQELFELLWLDNGTNQWRRVVGGTSDVEVFSAPIDGYDGYMRVVLTDATTPAVSYLNDGDWGGYAGPSDIPDPCGGGLFSAVSLGLLCVFCGYLSLRSRYGRRDGHAAGGR